jgi:hypothetical protein
MALWRCLLSLTCKVLLVLPFKKRPAIILVGKALHEKTNASNAKIINNQCIKHIKMDTNHASN